MVVYDNVYDNVVGGIRTQKYNNLSAVTKMGTKTTNGVNVDIYI